MKKTLLTIFIMFLSTQSFSTTLKMISDTDIKSITEKIELNWGKDAFSRSKTIRAKKTTDFKIPTLSAILYDPNDPLAIINGETVGKRAIIAGREIIEIGKNYVLLKKGKSIVELQLQDNNN